MRDQDSQEFSGKKITMKNFIAVGEENPIHPTEFKQLVKKSPLSTQIKTHGRA